ncbi:MAG TPA: SLBB domain-containing protein [Pirellulales bacterium]|nr:SLBB domain-containing protein [Pirellulales bacterium]
MTGSCLLLALLLGCSAGCSSLTLFPAGDFLLSATEQVRRAPPRMAPLPRELEKTVLSTFVVQCGDSIVIEPASLESPLRFPTDQTVLADGTIDLNKYGRLVVAGKSIEEIEAAVSAAIQAIDKQPAPINVRLVNPNSAMYYVLGEVNSPGSFPLIGRETVLDAILAAGGLSDKAAQCDIILTRPTPPGGCRMVLPVCYRQIVQLGDTSSNYQIMPGDRVYVATRSLCEQLLPLHKKSCPLCCGLQCPCLDPTEAPYLPTVTPSTPSTIVSEQGTVISQPVEELHVPPAHP